MYLFNSFLFCGFVCLIAQIVLDNTKLSPGHITSIFVCIGAFLDTFDLYDYIIKNVGGGALLPITSFGHSLVHSALSSISDMSVINILDDMFCLTSTGISSAIIFSFVFSIIFKPHN